MSLQLQYNPITGTVYGGQNQATLLAAKEENNYKSNEWMTWIQISNCNLQLIDAKGKGVRILNRFVMAEKKTKDGKVKDVSIPTGSTVLFNTDLVTSKEEK